MQKISSTANCLGTDYDSVDIVKDWTTVTCFRSENTRKVVPYQTVQHQALWDPISILIPKTNNLIIPSHLLHGIVKESRVVVALLKPKKLCSLFPELIPPVQEIKKFSLGCSKITDTFTVCSGS